MRARDAIRHSPTVPSEFWEADQLKEALATWHIGKVIRAYRHHPFHGPSPLAQELVAGWLGMTQPQLSRVEHGRPIYDLERLTRWAQTLHIPGEYLWFKLPEQQANMLERCQDRKLTADTDDVSLGKENVENLNLGSLLSDLAADRIPLLDTRVDGARTGVMALGGMSLPQRAELLLKLFLQLDDELGGDVLYPPLSRYVDRLAVTIEEGSSDDLAAFGELAQMTGWLALDANHHAAARRYLTTTIYVAHEVDDPALAANALAYLSLQETYRARPDSACSLAQTAFAIGDGRMTPLTKTVLGTRLARAYAGLRQTSECLRALDQVRVDFARMRQDEEPVWVAYVDEVEIAAQEGACYLDLGMTAEASAALTRALELLQTCAPHRVRDRIHYLTRLAKCHLLDREVERACEIATEALALDDTVGSARIVERLTEFSHALDPFGDTEAVRGFRELFVAVMALRRRSPYW